ncbi:heme utilization cystosolic carrier protein HutX [Rhodobacteraceae bacterium RKSG542]|uniref:heme utilization cystosolic carrier protein HutX n=1 Tax=Pseudovibrio flavus TaxID=2529854 RepID=UPI0012BC7D51|nr:heme utilization cystosolic carrier protein HutX [Pseudovibrio flavus]MTI17115.1 heme utilization cystosolic carrier protein HutX [Pseudovibrio flavus]
MTDKLAALSAKLAENPAVLLETVATEEGITLLEAVRCLPETMWHEIEGDAFDRIIQALPSLGEVTTVCNTGSMIFEVSGVFPEGTYARGFYNLKKTAGGFSGHIKADACTSIVFMERPFFTSKTASINFFDAIGACYLKVFLKRDADGNILADQLATLKSLVGCAA